MRKLLLSASWLGAVSFLACSGSDQKPPAADPPTELVSCPACGGPVRMAILDGALAQGVTINEIAAFQTLKYPIMKDGMEADHGRMLLASKRETLLRLYLTTGPGWTPHPITATFRFVTVTPQGYYAQTIVSEPYTPGKPPAEGDLTSTLNVTIPGDRMLADTSFSVWLTDPQGKPAQAMDPARYPRDGSVTSLGTQRHTDKLRVRLVKVQYNADGSGRLPDTSPAQVEIMRKVFYQLFPAGQVDIDVREDPFPWAKPISFGGAGWDELLTAIGGLRSSDNLPPQDVDIYYYGMFCPAPSQGGGIAGLSPVGAPYSIGVGYPGKGTASTAAHEVGHAHGLLHAPCGGAGGPDPMFPYPDGSIGIWGFDQIEKKLLDPAGSPKWKDLMSYCNPDWVSDYHYARLLNRVQSNNRIAQSRTPEESFYSATVETDGTLRVSDLGDRHWWSYGEAREVEVGDLKTTGYYFPYDHLPGGVMMVPESVRARSRAYVPHLVRK